MHDVLSSGRLIDGILLLVAVEAVALIIWLKLKPVSVALTLAPGVCLMLALRGALTGASTAGILLWVTLALPLHLADLWSRHKK